MLSQGEIEALSITTEKAAARLEKEIMKDIVRRIKINSEITSSAEWQIQRLRQLGESEQYIKSEIQRYLKVSDSEMERLFQTVPENEYKKFESVFEELGVNHIPFLENDELQDFITSTMIQTKSTFQNITNTLGFSVIKDGVRTFTPLSRFYQETLDNAILGMTTGGFSFDVVLKNVVQEMTIGGLRTVNYASGRSYRVESAARMALMTGFGQITGYMNEQTAAKLGTSDYEISYHIGARPSHQEWQGTVKSYEELKTICGLGTITGLCGINCYHWYEPFIRGVSVRNYTDKQLRQMIKKENTPKQYEGKAYTTYEALQQQRKMELLMRKQRQDISLLSEGVGNDFDQLVAQINYRDTMNRYVEFSKAMKLPQQRERVYMDGLGRVGKSGKISVAKAGRSDTMRSGARITDPESEKGRAFAKNFYPEIRKRTTDIKKIANNIRKPVEKIQRLKEYLFLNESFYDEDLQVWRRFDEDCAIAQSWQRLTDGKDIQPHDRTLIEHEFYEMKLKEDNPKLTHSEAHMLAQEKYNYQQEVKVYYDNLNKSK